ncbi:cyclic nucleotide-binding domain-containing protein [Verrucomicrobiales bacterium]|jgi:CRP-like cAMP-binding protein|nr:cyclic nucleotide-binding domain-containing protein [Verrucomicrobiales bacterium]MDC0321879.1 cyclic nucleotide-binding domain-containing protein [Verrucomicrobiales bacterium]
MANLLDLCSDLAVRSFQKRDVVLKEDEKDGEILILKSGTLEIQKSGTVVTTVANPGSIVGEIAVLLDRGHSATAIALSDCELYVMEAAKAELAAHPELYREVARVLANRLMRVSDAIVELRNRVEVEKEFSDFELSMFWDL